MYIDEFRELLGDAPQASQIFEQKLVSLGYIDKAAYESIYFVKGNRDYYCVDETFPRLVTQNVSSVIVSAQYDLSIAGIQPWRADGETVWS